MSNQPRKQRTRTRRAPLHEKGAQLNATLTADLREEFGTRRIRVNAGDTVEVLRGDHRDETGEVLNVDVKDGTIHVEDVVIETADGEEVPRPLEPSNVRITELDRSDDRRMERLEPDETEDET